MSERVTDGTGRGGPDPRLLIGLGILLVVGMVALAVLGDTGGPDVALEPDPPPLVTETPTPQESAPPATEPPVTPAPAQTPEPPPTPEEPATPEGPRAPTAGDASAFTAGYELPDDASDRRDLLADLDGDEVAEVVVAYLSEGVARTDVARWTGTRYQVVLRAEGGAAERFEDVRVTDLTGDGRLELLVFTAAGERGQSMAVYGLVGDVIDGLRADGGCWDSSFVYGTTGVDIARGTITATCLDPEATRDVYTFEGERFAFTRSEGGDATEEATP